MVRRYFSHNSPPGLAPMIDKDSLIGMGGTATVFSGSLHEYIGVAAGSLTILFMLVKLYQEFRKRK